jgi:hypothetical protein
MDKHTQESRILSALNHGATLSPLEALKDFGCMRLGARIYDLRCKGNKIKSCLTEYKGKHFAIYWISKQDRRK